MSKVSKQTSPNRTVSGRVFYFTDKNALPSQKREFVFVLDSQNLVVAFVVVINSAFRIIAHGRMWRTTVLKFNILSFGMPFLRAR